MTAGGGALHDDLAMTRQPRQLVLRGDARQRGGRRGGQRSRSAQVDIEPVVGCGHLDVERLAHRLDRLGDRPGGGERAVERRREDRAAVDGDDLVRARRGEADLEHVALAAARMQHRAAAAFAMGVDQFVDRCVEPGLRQRLDDQAALPVAIARRGPMLERAAAADAEMRAHRRDPLRARLRDLDRQPAVGMAGPGFGFDDLAGQRERHKHRPIGRIGDAVAAPSETRNRQTFDHALE